jgi:hypothetical protein
LQRRYRYGVAGSPHERRTVIRIFLPILAVLSLTACDPYSPGQRALGGGAIGAGTGAAVGGLVGGHAGTGAAIGGALGAIGGAASTPERPTYGYASPGYGYRNAY